MHTILAVDDEPANQRAVRRTLGEEYRVLTAGSAAEGLALLAGEPVTLVLSDHRMPGMTGAAFLAETVERHPDVVRVVVTGYAEPDVLLEAINRGHVYHVLCKPWQVHELRLVVRRGIERWEAARERRALHAALEAACARAERASAQKSRLLALAAHELGTPLHQLVNALALLGEHPLPPAAAPWLALAERAVQWLVAGAAHLQTAARVEARALRVTPRPLALRPLIAATCAAVAAAAGRAVALAAEGGDDAVTAAADPDWVAAALRELLTNALRATPDGGRITVTLAAGADAAALHVCDTGVGIPAAHLPDICEPFGLAGGELLLHGSGRFAFGARGLGLGLASVRGIAAAHGGRLAIESTPGVGTTVSLILPRG